MRSKLKKFLAEKEELIEAIKEVVPNARIEDIDRLIIFSPRIQRYNEIYANDERGLTKLQEKRMNKMEEEIQEIAKKWNIRIDVTGDPRGLPIKLKLKERGGRYNMWDGLSYGVPI